MLATKYSTHLWWTIREFPQKTPHTITVHDNYCGDDIKLLVHCQKALAKVYNVKYVVVCMGVLYAFYPMAPNFRETTFS